MTTLILAAFAVWRATTMIAGDEEGPFSAFAWIRDRIDPHQKTWLGRGIRCEWCVSWWAGLAAALWMWYFGYIEGPTVPLWWFGLSGISVLLSVCVERLFRRR